MQKKLIALAIAGLVSAPAFAQSNVTIYGVADAGLAWGEHGDNDFSGVLSGVLSGSRLGFRGTEDLGNGLKAVFTLEQGFDIGNGAENDSSKAFQRQAFVGLAGGFGAVTLGRQYAPGYDFQYDALASAIISPQAILSGAPIGGKFGEIAGAMLTAEGFPAEGAFVAANVKDAALTINPGSSARWDNSIAYNGTFGAIRARAIYSFGGNEMGNDATGIDADSDDMMGVGLEYANGPLKVGGVYHYLKDKYDFAGVSDDQQEWLVGGSYNFGVLTLAGSYQQASNANYIRDLDVDLWQVGVIVPVGAAGNVHLAYGEAEYDFDGESKSKSYTLAYTHALSKRTTAYVGYNRTDNDEGLALGPIASGVAYNATTDVVTGTGEESDIVAVGIRHTF